jgi:fused signal recognition particle receptor
MKIYKHSRTQAGMFDILRKKFSSVIKKTVKQAKKAVKAAVKAPKKTKEAKVKVPKASKKAGKKQTKSVREVLAMPEPQQEIEEKVIQPQLEAEEEAQVEEEAEITPEPKLEIKSEEEAPSGFGFFSKIKKFLAASKLTQEQFDEAFEELELTLLENNVALESVDVIRQHLSSQLVNKDIKKDKVDVTIIESLKEAILSVVKEPPNIFQAITEKKEPYVILFFGINGTGKTTTIAKLAHMLKEKGISSVMAAGDTFRAAAIEQLKTHADKVGVPIIEGKYGADPASIAFDAIQYAKKHRIKAVLIDTAGRMYTKENLLREMDKIVRVSKPDLKLFVGESITGNDATDQTRTFNDSIGIDGIVLTKADIDEKAGTILSVSQVTGKPIYFLGTGQNYKDLELFTKKTVLKNLGLD